MIALFLLPIYIFLVFYIFKRTRAWLKNLNLRSKPVAVILFITLFLIALTPLEAILIKANPYHHWLKQISNYWLGVVLYTLLTIAVFDLIRVIIHFTEWRGKFNTQRNVVISGFLCFAIITSVSTYGIYNANNIKTKKYNLTTDKACGDIKAVLIADLHLGYNIGLPMMTKLVAKINAQHPDIVFLAGDIFDNEYDAIKDADLVAEKLSEINSKYGVYACWGNHDINEMILAGFTFGGVKKPDQRMPEFLKKANITLLTDESVLINNEFYVIGREDEEKSKKQTPSGRKTVAELTENLDKSKPIFVIDHEPRELQVVADAGADFDLCGHTHDGQVFPGNLTIKLFWENACGYLKKDNMHNIVTSGVGLFGPDMRVGTDSEICVLNISSTNKQ